MTRRVASRCSVGAAVKKSILCDGTQSKFGLGPWSDLDGSLILRPVMQEKPTEQVEEGAGLYV